MGSKHKGDKDINYCAWCGAPTIMERMQLPQTPILEFLEEKIDKLGRDKVWGENSNWSALDIDSDTEAELLVYDEMLSTIELKTVCENCIGEDDRLWRKYYSNPDDNNDDWEFILR